ncbi:DNA polymerase [Kitasatospora sp. NPDC056184]|uniref:DNA polymerase n=1 Tax=Kitasatospora sp. NPDC056184 TaxID=3345738 RepID=UPI0035DB21F0
MAGQPITMHRVEHPEDLDAFREFIRRNQRGLGFDLETTGLEVFQPDYRVRLAQFGNADESWILPVEQGAEFQAETIAALGHLAKVFMNNGTFDFLSMDQAWGVKAETMFPKLVDNRILGHLVDSRGKKDGFGHDLEFMTGRYLCKETAERVKGSMGGLAKAYKTTKAKIWRIVDLQDPVFNLYAGMDPVLSYRLAMKLGPMVPASSHRLIPYEHKLAEICAYMARTGYLLDRDYTKTEAMRLRMQEDFWKAKALFFGLENINSPKQVAEALIGRGIKIKDRTPSGDYKVDKVLLSAHRDDPLVEAIIEGKRAGKWAKTWFETFLETADPNGRCHASINSIQARTARMSITGIPAQTLPSGDPYVRNCFIADEGHVTAAVDYKAQELRVAAALSQDPVMMRAFLEGADLHQITADGAKVPRGIGKMTNFLSAYGGGAKALTEQSGLPFREAAAVIKAFWKTYPGLAKYNELLSKKAIRSGHVETPVGRRLVVDDDRPYSALNYMIQSTSRDVTGSALIRLHEAGYTPFMRLPVHDEAVFSFPAGQAHEMGKEAARIMRQQMTGVLIDTDLEVAGRSWGSKYEQKAA